MKRRMKLDYNNLMREIYETLATEGKDDEEIAETVKSQGFYIGIGLEILTAYLKEIATLAIERNDEELIDICKGLLIVSEKGGTHEK